MAVRYLGLENNGLEMENNILIQNNIIPNWVDAAACSIVGCRKEQQDFAALFQDEGGIAACVCDGMGGLNGGEIASREAAMLFFEDYRSFSTGEITTKLIPEFLKTEAIRLNEKVVGLKTENGKMLNAGSTVVAVVMERQDLYWLSVGDSRLYLLRNGKLRSLTKNHNYQTELEERLQAGSISQDYYEQEIRSKRRNALTSYLGMNTLRKIDLSERPFPLREGDELLLCSDGVYKSLNDQQIQALLKDNRISAAVTTRRIVNMALQMNPRKQDNTTAIVIQYRN